MLKGVDISNTRGQVTNDQRMMEERAPNMCPMNSVFHTITAAEAMLPATAEATFPIFAQAEASSVTETKSFWILLR